MPKVKLTVAMVIRRTWTSVEIGLDKVLQKFTVIPQFRSTLPELKQKKGKLCWQSQEPNLTKPKSKQSRCHNSVLHCTIFSQDFFNVVSLETNN